VRIGGGALVATAAVLAGLALPTGEARALSCAPPPSGSFSGGADVVFDAVLLSGPREDPLGPLVSTARMHVLRYLKGRGPRTVAVGTGVPLLVTGDDPGVFSSIPGLFEPHAGQLHRVFGQTPKGAGASTRLGVYTPHGCSGTFERRLGTYLRGVRGSRVASREAGGRRWAAELLRGPAPLRCLRVHPGLDPDAVECDHLRRGGDLLAAVVPAGGRAWATAVAVSGPGLASIEVHGPAGTAVADASGPGRIALAVLRGYAERADLAVTARLKDGRIVTPAGFGGGLRLVDPRREDWRWGLAERVPNPAAPGVRCVVFGQRPDTTREGSVVSYPRHGECGSAAGGFLAVRYVDRYDDAHKRYRYGGIAFGAVPPGTDRVTVAGAGAEREAALDGTRGVFGLMLPASASHAELTVTFHRTGGGSTSVAGQRSWNVVPPPRSPLDR
jgi:hypothetical protein